MTTTTVKRRKTAGQRAATTSSSHPEPRPVLIYKKLDEGYAAKYGRFEGFGKTQKTALDELLVTMYKVVSNVIE